ncbi:MAG TPA: cytochrome c peroxidase [Hyphomicrobiaceae bacterium]|nr:cytochrome c peroxidase [Hyphomicrobiaceae bacterium]
MDRRGGAISTRIVNRVLAALAIAGLMIAGAPIVAQPSRPDLGALKALFRRPDRIPHPVDAPLTPERIALGRTLFFDPRLSSTGVASCASCHDPRRAFTDGGGRGVTGRSTKNAAPMLWNLAWARALFWDGRAPTLEAQLRGPIESPDELGTSLQDIARRLNADTALRTSFARAFPEKTEIDSALVVAALAAFERSLVSPPTRFDQWIAGDSVALTRAEIDGFTLFTGKAGCSVCHGGWRFTDDKRHDIGRPITTEREDRNPAVKTPTLRELTWTAPYMHDGSLPTLESVVDHYADRIIDRATLAPELRRRQPLSQTERSALVTFLMSLSGASPPPLPD